MGATKMVGAMEMRREIWDEERPTSQRSWAMRGVRAMSTVYLGEDPRVPGDCGGDLGFGDTDSGEEGSDGVSIVGRLETGQVPGGPAGLPWRQAAVGGEVVLDGELRGWSGVGGAVEKDTVDGEGGCGGERLGDADSGKEAASEAEHRYSPAMCGCESPSSMW